MYVKKDFICSNFDLRKIEGPTLIKAEAPSNIALVKYWGKFDGQIPMNPSVSFTLSQSKSITSAEIKKKDHENDKLSFSFYFDGDHKPEFEPKIQKFLENILPYSPFINNLDFIFDSTNTFPHSSGIASSASGFAALAKIIIQLEKQLSTDSHTDEYWRKKTSFLARIGSGSAARSIEGPVTLWGEHPKIHNSSNLYAVKPDIKLHPNFHHFQDSIVLVEKGQKKVSSSAGHQLMDAHLFKEQRKKQAFENSQKIIKILENGDIDAFIEMVESEALGLHALMMTSTPNYLLMQPETLKIIHEIRNYRNQTGSKLCFTLDAGANVHVLFPKKETNSVKNFLNSITNKEILDDYIKMN